MRAGQQQKRDQGGQHDRWDGWRDRRVRVEGAGHVGGDHAEVNKKLDDQDEPRGEGDIE